MCVSGCICSRVYVCDASECDGISDVFLRDAAWSSLSGRRDFPSFPATSKKRSLKSILKRVAHKLPMQEWETGSRAQIRFPKLTIMGTWEG